MGTLQQLLQGTQVPGPGNRLWNWAEKVSAAVDSGGVVSVATISAQLVRASVLYLLTSRPRQVG